MKLFIPAVLLLITFVLPLTAQRRDPLNEKEIDQIRNSKQEPNKRLKLYVKFATERMERLEKVRTDPRLAENRGPQMHDLLEDLDNIVNEMDDNVEMYANDNMDIRKSLKDIIEADTAFQAKLTAISDAAKKDPAVAEQMHKYYEFMLQNTSDSVNSSLEDAKDTLANQEKLDKEKKLRKPE